MGPKREGFLKKKRYKKKFKCKKRERKIGKWKKKFLAPFFLHQRREDFLAKKKNGEKELKIFPPKRGKPNFPKPPIKRFGKLIKGGLK